MCKTVLYSIVAVSLLLAACTQEKSKADATIIPKIEPEKKKISYPKELTLDFIMGRFDPVQDSSFSHIMTQHADRAGMLMKTEAYEAFQKMYSAALDDGVRLVIKSAARNFNYQKGIWERKWTGETILSNGNNAKTTYAEPGVRAQKILEYSSMPGTSRHHWGTDIDFNSFDNRWFESGEGLKLFTWLEKNAESYGFCRPYTTKDSLRPHGYNEEKWHWSYTPLSDIYTAYAAEKMKASNVQGFAGSEVAEQLDVVNHYVLGINHNCNH